ncbi:DUF1566 domain-containing protein [Aeromonas veronii]|uniref:DUF1566 domain-containing protein n=1 Tax=Aeromonas veronii TaxID=654 RepID=UPI000F5E7EE9|nr:DUF1566 domain-containing protein [Aeromonas veronii]MBA2081086.1 hypothetical protein [Aeromonas veronii]MCX0420812.1 DUF1566 domain-containing protein [Aeromonas veronii]RRA91045.1 DUF1566 domain-containing protein [Aeromonas veronii bv. sobria]TNI74213.1 hypothetical protein CF109_07235 [Aeromonas veronii]WIJ40636.1 DUF1566 domain-containing protein [Aeromonas veronii]
MHNSLFPLLLAAVLLPAASQARECLPGYQDDGTRFVSELIDTAEGKLQVVNDRATGLQWLYCPYGQQVSGNGSGCEGMPEVINSRASLSDNPLMTIIMQANDRLGSPAHPWRAPDIKELFTLYNPQCQPATYSAVGFPDPQLAADTEALKQRACEARFDALTEEQTQACNKLAEQSNTLTMLKFISDSSSGDGYNYLEFAPSHEVFNDGRYGAPMLRLVRPIPNHSE